MYSNSSNIWDGRNESELLDSFHTIHEVAYYLKVEYAKDIGYKL